MGLEGPTTKCPEFSFPNYVPRPRWDSDERHTQANSISRSGTERWNAKWEERRMREGKKGRRCRRRRGSTWRASPEGGAPTPRRSLFCPWRRGDLQWRYPPPRVVWWWARPVLALTQEVAWSWCRRTAVRRHRTRWIRALLPQLGSMELSPKRRTQYDSLFTSSYSG